MSYLANHTPFDLLLVEDAAMLEAVLAGRKPREAFPSVKKIVLMAPGSEASQNCYSNEIIYFAHSNKRNQV